MKKEIERKFLIKSTVFHDMLKYIGHEVKEVQQIMQCYLKYKGTNESVRIRIVNSTQVIMTYKSKGSSAIERNELETELDMNVNDAIALFNSSRYKLTKTRYDFGDHIVDDFGDGLIMGEMEFNSIEECEKYEDFPTYFGKEVTDDPSYLNVVLAERYGEAAAYNTIVPGIATVNTLFYSAYYEVYNHDFHLTERIYLSGITIQGEIQSNQDIEYIKSCISPDHYQTLVLLSLNKIG